MQGLGFTISEDSLLPVLYLFDFPVGRDGFKDVSLNAESLFGGVAQKLAVNEFFVVVTSPSLYHHQQVQMASVLWVVGLEVVVGVGDIAFQLA